MTNYLLNHIRRNFKILVVDVLSYYDNPKSHITHSKLYSKRNHELQLD